MVDSPKLATRTPARSALAKLGLLGVLGLAACRSTPPGAVEPVTLDETVTLPGAFEAPRPDTTAPADARGWWHDLGVPELALLVDEGLAASPDLAAAAQSVRIAAMRLGAAGGADLPQVQATMGWNRARNNLIGIPLPGSDGVVTTYSTSANLGLNISWEVDLWGRLDSLEAGALARLEANGAEWNATREALAAELVRVAVGLARARALEQLAAAQLENARTRLASARRLFERGAGSPEGVLAVEASVAALVADLAEARRAREALVPALAALSGRPIAELPPVDALAAVLHAATPPPPPAGLPADLVARRPDLVALEARLEAAQADTRVARAERYPRLSLTASGGTSGDELEKLVDGDFRVWSLGANLLAPIFQGGALEAAEGVAVAERDRALYAFVRGVVNALAEVEMALVGEARTAERVAGLELQLERLAENEALVARRQTRGTAAADALFAARSQTLAARSALAAARAQALTYRVDLHLALGGSFTPDDPSAPTAPTAPVP